ncbi:DNA-binding transcriptional regulator, MerR family [Modestobacter sp. DSM 44400]|nr:DNA-binding transcriptional regulator, MerR family [Modestobacter sp. DSM 44400]
MARVRSGQLAEAGGVHVETLRYYERRGLLESPPRRGSGYREYPAEAVQRLRLIKQAQALGFTLDEIAELLALNPHAAVACGDMEDRVRSKMAELDEKLDALAELRGSLERVLCECCDGRQAQEACPALSPQHDPAPARRR